MHLNNFIIDLPCFQAKDLTIVSITPELRELKLGISIAELHYLKK